MRKTVRLGILSLGALLCTFNSNLAAAEDVASPKDVDRSVVVASVRSDLGQVKGVISNRSSLPVFDVTLLIQQTYLWPNEFKPTGESPSRAVVRHIAGPIAPGQSLEFVEALPVSESLPGTFETQATILGYHYQDTNTPGNGTPPPDSSPQSFWISDFLTGC